MIVERGIAVPLYKSLHKRLITCRKYLGHDVLLLNTNIFLFP